MLHRLKVHDRPYKIGHLLHCYCRYWHWRCFHRQDFIHSGRHTSSTTGLATAIDAQLIVHFIFSLYEARAEYGFQRCISLRFILCLCLQHWRQVHTSCWNLVQTNSNRSGRCDFRQKHFSWNLLTSGLVLARIRFIPVKKRAYLPTFICRSCGSLQTNDTIL